MSELKDKPAWKLLSKDEQTALALKFGLSKSTWESGEIMAKAHYKFLEIEARAIAFMKLFTAHFDAYQELIPSFIDMPPELRSYLRYTMGERLPVKEALEKIANDLFRIGHLRESLIERYLRQWESSDDIHENNLYQLIVEFDRWNNFRILPPSIQEPSAFKRRQKTREKKRVENLLNFNSVLRKKIKQKFEAKMGNSDYKRKTYFIVLFESIDIYEVIRVSLSKDELTTLSNLNVYVFSKQEYLEDYLSLIREFFSKRRKHCREGQQFWPKYREAIIKAANFHEVQNIAPSRRYLTRYLRDFIG